MQFIVSAKHPNGWPELHLGSTDLWVSYGVVDKTLVIIHQPGADFIEATKNGQVSSLLGHDLELISEINRAANYHNRSLDDIYICDIISRWSAKDASAGTQKDAFYTLDASHSVTSSLLHFVP